MLQCIHISLCWSCFTTCHVCHPSIGAYIVGYPNTVYKLIGPVLVKQDLDEAKATVSKRLDTSMVKCMYSVVFECVVHIGKPLTDLFFISVSAMKLYWRRWRGSLSSIGKFCPAYSRSTSALRVRLLGKSEWILDTSPAKLRDWICLLITHACSHVY